MSQRSLFPFIGGVLTVGLALIVPAQAIVIDGGKSVHLVPYSAGQVVRLHAANLAPTSSIPGRRSPAHRVVRVETALSPPPDDSLPPGPCVVHFEVFDRLTGRTQYIGNPDTLPVPGAAGQ